MRAIAFFVLTGVAVVVSTGALLIPASPPRPPETKDAEAAARARVQDAERIHGADAMETEAALTALQSALQSRHGECLEEGAAVARRALTIRERHLGLEHADVAPALEDLAMWLWWSRDLEAMRALVERALAIRQRAQPADDLRIGVDMHFLADIYVEQGDVGRALALRERALPFFERAGDRLELADQRFRLAALRNALGDWELALPDALQALTVREELLDPSDPRVARSVNLVGFIRLNLGDLSGAESAFLRSRDMSEGSDPGARRGWTNAVANLGRVALARGEWARAVDLFRAAIDRRGWPGVTADLLAELGGSERRAGNPDARAHLTRALEMERRRQPLAPRSTLVLRELAMLDASDGRLRPAVLEALEAERIKREDFRTNSIGLSERQILTQDRTSVAGLDLAWTWAVQEATQDRLEDQVAVELVDEAIRSRALVLDALATRRRVLALHQDEKTAECVEDLARAQHRLARLVSDMSATPDRLVRAQGESERAERRLAERSREYRSGRDRGEIGLSDVRAAVPPRTMLVSYFRHDAVADPSMPGAGSGYVASLVAPDDPVPRIVPLGPSADIDRAVEAWREAVSQDPRLRGTSASETAYVRAAHELERRVWEPIASRLGSVDRVFIVPDGALEQVNFATLPTPSGVFLAEQRYAIHYLTAERDLVESSGTRAGRGLLVIGDPDFGAVTSPGRRAFDPLPGSRREALDVVSFEPSRETVLLTGEEATEASFKQLAPRSRVVHVATHSFSTTAGRVESPLRVAGLAMAGANRIPGTEESAETEDGLLTAEEIALLDLRNVEWTVLSGCETGLGGVRRAFQIAGARSLVVSLWPVDDDATRHWMRALYEARRRGVSAVDSVHAATRDALAEQRRAGLTTHPYSWGGFVSVGDWR